MTIFAGIFTRGDFAGGDVIEVGGAGNLDLGRPELRAVEEESCLCSTIERSANLLWNVVCDGTYVAFSKFTVADCGLSEASEAGVTEREVIFPLKVITSVQL